MLLHILCCILFNYYVNPDTFKHANIFLNIFILGEKEIGILIIFVSFIFSFFAAILFYFNIDIIYIYFTKMIQGKSLRASQFINQKLFYRQNAIARANGSEYFINRYNWKKIKDFLSITIKNTGLNHPLWMCNFSLSLSLSPPVFIFENCSFLEKCVMNHLSSFQM